MSIKLTQELEDIIIEVAEMILNGKCVKAVKNYEHILIKGYTVPTVTNSGVTYRIDIREEKRRCIEK
jgi:hypothetical protein